MAKMVEKRYKTTNEYACPDNMKNLDTWVKSNLNQ